jgi:ERCC4-related helicase
MSSPLIDPVAIQSWIYPTNYPIRKYQQDIVEKCLFNNTLVSLPTGLGKTLIAAVVMYNYYRWFPTGKIIFMAPTKPLVSQQMSACHEIMNLPEEDTAQFEGSVPAKSREALWQKKRVFFCTPQIVDNDLQEMRLKASGIVCIVIDEAHRATGQYAYVKVVIFTYTHLPS